MRNLSELRILIVCLKLKKVSKNIWFKKRKELKHLNTHAKRESPLQLRIYTRRPIKWLFNWFRQWFNY